MSAQRSRGNRDGEKEPVKAGDPASGDGKPGEDDAALGLAEARDLLSQLGADLVKLQAFVDAETHATKRKAPSPKRLARLRLVSEDVTSAVKLSSKSAKS